MTDTANARLIAIIFEDFEIDHTPDGWPAVKQMHLSAAAKELRRLADRVDDLERMRQKQPLGTYRSMLHPAGLLGIYCPQPPAATSHTTNHTGTVAVATDRYWLPITPATPRGVKLHLLNNTGAGTTGILTAANIQHFCGWEPMAKIPPGMLKP